MADYSPEDIQSAADEVRRGNFGDFMFRDPGFMNRTSGRHTSRRNTSRRNTSRRRHTSSHRSSRNTSRRCTTPRRTTRRTPPKPRRCCTSIQSNLEIERCWEGSNQSYFRSRRI